MDKDTSKEKARKAIAKLENDLKQWGINIGKETKDVDAEYLNDDDFSDENVLEEDVISENVEDKEEIEIELEEKLNDEKEDFDNLEENINLKNSEEDQEKEIKKSNNNSSYQKEKISLKELMKNKSYSNEEDETDNSSEENDNVVEDNKDLDSVSKNEPSVEQKEKDVEKSSISEANSNIEKIPNSELNKIDLSILTHEQFVALVKSYPNLENKIWLMGKRISILNNKSNQATMTIQELKQRSIKLLKDFNDSQKRFSEESDSIKQNSLKSFLKDFIGTIDIFEQALKVDKPSKELENWLVGFRMIYRNIFNVLENNGVKKIEIKPGDKPDYNFHNSIEIVETNEVPDGTIYKVVQDGYLLNDKLLRVASVSVAKSTTKDSKEEKEKTEDKKEEDKKENNLQ